MNEPITWPKDFIDRLIERTAKVQDAPKLTPDQEEALIHLLAKATKAGCLPSPRHTLCLLDLIEEGLPPRGSEPDVDRETR